LLSEPGKKGTWEMDNYNGRPAPSIPRSLTIIVMPIDRRGSFSARLEGGRLLVIGSRVPFCDAARELLRLGYGPDMLLLMRHQGNSAAALRSTVSAAARLTVKSAGNGCPIFALDDGAQGVAAPPVRRTAPPLVGMPSAELPL
jgi:hypothetical protein